MFPPACITGVFFAKQEKGKESSSPPGNGCLRVLFARTVTFKRRKKAALQELVAYEKVVISSGPEMRCELPQTDQDILKFDGVERLRG